MRAREEWDRRLCELAGRAAKTGIAQITPVLTPAERGGAGAAGRRAGVRVWDWGGGEEAQRRMVAFAGEDGDISWPAKWLAIRWNARYGAPGHRDLLGALLALGIERETLGDLTLGEGEAFAPVLEGMASYLQANLSSAGRTAVRASVLEQAPALPREEAAAVRTTVPSLRLDAVMSAGWGLSRAEAAERIVSGRVLVDYQAETRPDRQVAEGTRVSARGLGRLTVQEIAGRTKKNRISVKLLR